MKLKKKECDNEAISFMYDRNNNRPDIEPCGTPQVICFIYDSIAVIDISVSVRDTF